MVSRIDRSFAVVIAACLLAAGATARASDDTPGADRPPGRLRALILSAGDPPGSKARAPVLRRILADSGRFEVRICESPDGLSAATFAPFDLLIVDTAFARGGDTEKAVAAAVAAGKGLVVTRGALEAAEVPDAWPLSAAGGPPRPARFLDVQVSRQDHPIARDLAATFRTADSPPDGLVARPGAVVIATAEQGGRSAPVLAASQHGKGRIVALALGDDTSAMHEPSFRAVLVRAGEWAASGTSTPTTTPRPPADPIRALLITGGHDHDAAFYGLFDGIEGVDRLPVDTAANAFKDDLRAKYDVIILYDFTRDLDEDRRKNLRDFVEGGKGVVVLHHALLDNQTWTWWSEDVVGGRYRLQREGDHPSSGVKDGQQILASPAADHPVLDGIGPFHIVDETYKSMYFSSRIKPLLTTDNPASDATLAWIGPCATSRVVAIQLGHGRSAFGHPAYRRLVHNAVLWAAGRGTK
jgi:type 1 glutamine amidotransferase